MVPKNGFVPKLPNEIYFFSAWFLAGIDKLIKLIIKMTVLLLSSALKIPAYLIDWEVFILFLDSSESA